MSKEKILSVTIKDCDVQTFHCGGAGGQHRDKTSNGVRIVHKASGASAESTDSRSQLANKRSAFKKMAETSKFKLWLNQQLYGKIEQERQIEQQVEADLADKNLRVEVKEDGEWVIE